MQVVELEFDEPGSVGQEYDVDELESVILDTSEVDSEETEDEDQTVESDQQDDERPTNVKAPSFLKRFEGWLNI